MFSKNTNFEITAEQRAYAEAMTSEQIEARIKSIKGFNRESLAETRVLMAILKERGEKKMKNNLYKLSCYGRGHGMGMINSPKAVWHKLGSYDSCVSLLPAGTVIIPVHDGESNGSRWDCPSLSAAILPEGISEDMVPRLMGDHKADESLFAPGGLWEQREAEKAEIRARGFLA